MRLNLPGFQVEHSEPLETTAFGFGDPRVIQQLLREKVYKHKPRVILQEYAANARDAHREVGKGLVPIEIKLPTITDCSLEIRDFGPGISEDRMHNVFIKYAASTKRDTNRDNGGFGIGAKCGLAYQNMFGIITIVEGHKYFYSVYLDEEGTTKLALNEKIACTDEPTGTTIVIAIEPKDVTQLYQCALYCTRFWSPQPNFINLPEEYAKYLLPLQATMRGDDWLIAETYDDRINFPDKEDNDGAMAIVDGIPYRIELASELVKLQDLKLTTQSTTMLTETKLVMFFGNGELDLAMNREDLGYSERTMNALTKRIEQVIVSGRQACVQVVEKASTYKEAALLAAKFYHSDDKVLQQLCDSKTILSWQGIQLPREFKLCTQDERKADKTIFEVVKYNKEGDKLYYYGGNESLKFGSLMVEADITSMIPARIRAISHLFGEHNEIYVLKPKLHNAQYRAQYEKEVRWHEFDVIKLSTITPKRETKLLKDEREPRIKHTGFCFKCASNDELSWDRATGIVMSEEELQAHEGIYVTKENVYYKLFETAEVRTLLASVKRGLGEEKLGEADTRTALCELGSLLKTPTEVRKVYAFSAKSVEKLGPKWIRLEDFVLNSITEWHNKQTANFKKLIQYRYRNAFEIGYELRGVFELCKAQALQDIVDKDNSLFFRMAKIYKVLQTFNTESNKQFWRIWRAFNNIIVSQQLRIEQELKDFRNEREQLETRYALLGLGSLSYHVGAKHIPHIIEYVNFCDSLYQQKQASLMAAQNALATAQVVADSAISPTTSSTPSTEITGAQ